MASLVGKSQAPKNRACPLRAFEPPHTTQNFQKRSREQRISSVLVCVVTVCMFQEYGELERKRSIKTEQRLRTRCTVYAALCDHAISRLLTYLGVIRNLSLHSFSEKGGGDIASLEHTTCVCSGLDLCLFFWKTKDSVKGLNVSPYTVGFTQTRFAWQGHPQSALVSSVAFSRRLPVQGFLLTKQKTIPCLGYDAIRYVREVRDRCFKS